MSDRVPVLIAGAGLSGLSTAVFLGLHGVPALVVERHASTSVQPKARGQQPHVMETMRLAGIDEQFVAASPKSRGFVLRIVESAAGPVFREILHDTYLKLDHLTPARSADASQASAERILLARARELGGEVRFATTLESFEQDEHGVRALLRDSGGTREIRADHLVGADGVRSPVRETAGIGTHGRGTLGHTILWLVRADLRHVVGERQVMYYMQNPRLSGGTGVLASTDAPDEFLVGVGYDPERESLADFTPDRALEQIRLIAGAPDLRAEILNADTTVASVRVADRFSAGRVHLVGDAAHTMPPQGGMGGNTAMMDGFHLAWKLAAVLRGEAGPGLLASHDEERRPIGELIAENQYRNAVVRNAPEWAEPDQEPPIEEPGLLLFGHRHPGAVVREPDDDGEVLEEPTRPTGRPGSRAPHVWLSTPDGRVSTIDHFGRGFVLLTESQSWAEAARDVAADLGVRLTPLLLGDDLTGDWTKPYGVTPEGASLIRPDFVIAWRSPGPGTRADLKAALTKILSR
ncbi:FAD-dependent monooxygenase [Saccharopolyspora flava]|uniref:2-polyprenyl-6-methoxyphenol hydroxylase n=1 Tax=Saccharopolyspora flava TaxID=95161 RepID=A0A1I6PM96_9PSEU|nr:FAD-dependent monooxygenase [Saccharopolyspora flava]SFS41309.1 2-polyprenyl-6-methoxyphenol hydroxylase [Saccharopolyspora flava]